MKRLIRSGGMAINKIMSMPGDTVVVYHGTGSQNVEKITSNGLNEATENSYQSGGASYGAGIWVTLNYDIAKGYAIDSAKGFISDNKNSDDVNITQFFNYGAVLEMEVSKDTLNDEGSASNNNLKSNDPISSDEIKQIYIFDINSGQSWDYF